MTDPSSDFKYLFLTLSLNIFQKLGITQTHSLQETHFGRCSEEFGQFFYILCVFSYTPLSFLIVSFLFCTNLRLFHSFSLQIPSNQLRHFTAIQLVCFNSRFFSSLLFSFTILFRLNASRTFSHWIWPSYSLETLLSSSLAFFLLLLKFIFWPSNHSSCQTLA